MKAYFYTIAALIVAVSASHSAEPGAAPVPGVVSTLSGCWEGRGEVMSKPVTITIAAKPIVMDAMFALDVESSAIADPKDRYSAHLIFGGAEHQPGKATDQIVGYWADSFGGTFTALGSGESRADGFDVTYRYPDADFVNRWRVLKDSIAWQIVMRGKQGVEEPFASYTLRKVGCQAG